MVYITMSLCTHPEHCIIVMVMWSINILSCSDQKLWNGKYEAEMGIIHTSIEHPKDEPRGIKCRNPGWRLKKLLICLTTCKSAIYRHFLEYMDWKLDLFVCLFYLYILLLFPLFLYTLALIIISLIPLHPSRACALFPHSHKASGSCPDSHVCSVFVWLLSLFWFCLSEFIFQLPIPGMCLLDHSFCFICSLQFEFVFLRFFISSHSV